MRSATRYKKSISLGLAILFFIPTNSYAINPMSYEESLRIVSPTDLNSVSENCPNMEAGWVKRENSKSGIDGDIKQWKYVKYENPRGSTLWLSASSVTCGDSFQIFASKYKPAKLDKGKRSISIIRLGWYGGSGGREYWRSSKFNLSEQNKLKPRGLLNTVETDWKPTITVKVENNWTPGLYLVAIKNSKNKIESVSPLIVRSKLHDSNLAFMHSTLTWQAYNNFGGYSLYRGVGKTSEEEIANRSRVVSFDRPYVGSGGKHINRDAVAMTQFLEKESFDVSHYADTDIDTQPSILRSYAGIIFSGHAEYVTRRVYEAVFAARNVGVNLAFFGANTFYWQARLSSSQIGSNRQVSVYRNELEDPEKDEYLKTVRWQTKSLSQPPNLLTGGLTNGVHVNGALITRDIPSWLKIDNKMVLGEWSDANEAEATMEGIAQPKSTRIILAGEFSRGKNTIDTSTVRVETTWYKSPTNALVFNGGLSMWSCELLESCVGSTFDDANRAKLQSITTQVLNAWKIRGVAASLS